MAITRKARGSGRSRRAGSKNKKGGSLLAGVVGALKTALPSIVLYEAWRQINFTGSADKESED